ncbi:hypothetical protein CEXT_662331 [Caerostris extrusa]|uniref:Uncharacterized protein n=1 Tax=Caerostris extrusa TaxID=172846 RepID=A0AAV4ND54_CAEEX|nr:hypothetical protein CEXT_662331 [Caerostris extrusa]
MAVFLSLTFSTSQNYLLSTIVDFFPMLICGAVLWFHDSSKENGRNVRPIAIEFLFGIEAYLINPLTHTRETLFLRGKMDFLSFVSRLFVNFISLCTAMENMEMGKANMHCLLEAS